MMILEYCHGLVSLVLKRTWDQKLSYDLLITFEFTLLFLFRFADTDPC